MKVIITGGAGFIGCNAALCFIKDGHEVVVYDDLSRHGTDVNIRWLQAQGLTQFVKGDIRDLDKLEFFFQQHRDVDVVLHLAAQVAVTTSIVDPRSDFEINAFGTFNVLEAVRKWAPDAIVLYSSTNKVYGAMDDVPVVESGGRYRYCDGYLPEGVPESRLLDFHSPYGCSKGAADQYVRDYGRIYGLKTVVLRQSCIYGYRQFGVEDQGWVAWFTIASVLGRPITIYGDGKQVRDLLFVDDLVRAYKQAVERIEVTSGQVYNLGGGHNKCASLLDVLLLLEGLLKKPIPVGYDDWRAGDQLVCILDIAKAQKDFGWAPRIGVEEGIDRLFRWVSENKDLF